MKSHPFFADVDWAKVEKKELQPPFIPKVANDGDTSLFDAAFTLEAIPDPMDSEDPSNFPSPDPFASFDWVNPNTPHLW